MFNDFNLAKMSKQALATFKKNWLKVAILFVVGLIFSRVEFGYIVGSEGNTFSLFELISPTLIAILGFVGGFMVAFGVNFVNLAETVLNEGEVREVTGALVRFLPVLFGMVYFALPKKEDYTRYFFLIVPVTAMLLFWAHPLINESWYYALFWVIPVAGYAFKENVFINALGATFTQHAIGSVAFLYAFNIPDAVWGGLVNIVPFERMHFALGATAFFLAYMAYSYATNKETASQKSTAEVKA